MNVRNGADSPLFIYHCPIEHIAIRAEREKKGMAYSMNEDEIMIRWYRIPSVPLWPDGTDHPDCRNMYADIIS